MIFVCNDCGKTREVETFHGKYKNKCNSCYVQATRRKNKLTLVSEHGTKCGVCGYDRCVQALDFHHIDPLTKSFGIAQAGVTRSLNRMREEAKKCILVCSNCHREIHAGVIDVKEYT
jgi:predicted HNH restriction endonuclease